MKKATVWRLTDWIEGESIQRDVARRELGETGDIKGCLQCPKPVWITVFFDGTGSNFVTDGGRSLDAGKFSYSNIAKIAAFAPAGWDRSNRTHGIYVPGVGTRFDAVNIASNDSPYSAEQGSQS